MTKRIIFIRPGETEWNRHGRWQGHVAVPLNEHGKMQATRLAQFIRPIGLDVIYSSDLRRAQDTTAILAQQAHYPIVYDSRWNERHIGIWQGLTLPEIESWYPEMYAELQADPHNYVIMGGESRAQVLARAKVAFSAIIATPHQTIGIVSHSTVIRTLLANISTVEFYKMSFRNMSVTSVMSEDEGQHWKITQLDDVTHLEGMESLFVGEVERKA